MQVMKHSVSSVLYTGMHDDQTMTARMRDRLSSSLKKTSVTVAAMLIGYDDDDAAAAAL